MRQTTPPWYVGNEHFHVSSEIFRLETLNKNAVMVVCDALGGAWHSADDDGRAIQLGLPDNSGNRARSHWKYEQTRRLNQRVVKVSLLSDSSIQIAVKTNVFPCRLQVWR